MREKAQEKVFADLGRVRALKRAKPGLLIGVGGCVASQEGERDRAARAVRGPGLRPADAAPPAGDDRARAARAARPQVDISFPEIEKFDHLPPRARRGRVGLRLDHGRLQQVLQLLRRALHARRGSLAARSTTCSPRCATSPRKGVKEVTLLGQNVNAYAGELDDGEAADFALLLAHVAQVEGIERIRYTTSHPLEFTQRLIDAYAKLPKLVSQVHLPVQSGSDRVLAAMKRNYTAMEYKLDRPAPARGAARTSRSPPTSSSASPARPTPTSSRR